jgi:hypothetical protein
MLTLVRQRTPCPAPNPHSQSDSELPPNFLWVAPSGATFRTSQSGGLQPCGPQLTPQPSSRTLVTKFSNSRRYRFFSTYSSESLHARAHQEIPLAPPPCLAIPRTCPYPPAVLLHALRRHFRHAAKCSSCEVLLPLLGITHARRLRKNVRVEALCLPLVGKNLCETPHAFTRPQFQRRPPLPPPRPRRTRSTANAAINCS